MAVGRTRLLIVVAVMAALLGAGVLVVAARRTPAGGEDRFDPAVRAELAARVVALLEHDPAGRRIVTSGTEPVGCAARPLGADPHPAGGTRPGAARTVYAWAICNTIVDGRPRTGVSMPIAVGFGPPVTVRHPADGAGYSTSVRRVFPGRLHPVLFDSSRYAPELASAADARVREIAGG